MGFPVVITAQEFFRIVQAKIGNGGLVLFTVRLVEGLLEQLQRTHTISRGDVNRFSGGATIFATNNNYAAETISVVAVVIWRTAEEPAADTAAARINADVALRHHLQ